MNDRPEHSDEPWEPLEDHEQPTRRVDRVEPDPSQQDVPEDEYAPADSGDDFAAEDDSSLAQTRLGSIPDLPFDPMAPYDAGPGDVTQLGQAVDQAADDELPLRRIRREPPAPEPAPWDVAPDVTPLAGDGLDELPVRPISRDDIPSRGYGAPAGYEPPTEYDVADGYESAGGQDAPAPYSVPQTTLPPPLYGGYGDPQGGRRRGRKTARERRDSGLYLPWWTLLILLGGVALIATLGILGLSALGGQFAPGGETPVVIVITSTPTLLPSTARPTLIATTTPFLLAPSPTSALESPTPAIAEATLPPEAYELRVGATVEIIDVGTAGLNVREGAGTSFPVLFIAPEGGRFEVIDGPETTGDLTWWQLRGVSNPDQTGWAVQEYLSVVVE